MRKSASFLLTLLSKNYNEVNKFSSFQREREREKDDLMVIFIMGKFQKIW